MPPVTVYTTPDCAACQAVKTHLTRHGVPFTERRLRDDPAALTELRARTDVRIAPVTVVGDQVFFGPFEAQRPALDQALGLRGGDDHPADHPDGG